jgi:hypothetical protein
VNGHDCKIMFKQTILRSGPFGARQDCVYHCFDVIEIRRCVRHHKLRTSYGIIFHNELHIHSFSCLDKWLWVVNLSRYFHKVPLGEMWLHRLVRSFHIIFRRCSVGAMMSATSHQHHHVEMSIIYMSCVPNRSGVFFSRKGMLRVMMLCFLPVF